MTGYKQNVIIYAIFLLIAFLGVVYGNEIRLSFSGLRIWQLENIVWLGLGIPFLFLQTSATLPDFLDANVSNKKRLFQPILIGAAFGLLDIIVIKFIQHPEPYTELPPFLQPFPYSLFLYFSGALEIEVFYRLIPFTLILLIGKRVSGGNYFKYIFWTAIVITSLREPLEQMPTGDLWFVVYSLLTGFLMNYLQAIYYTKAGFLASLILRLGHYLFWHILLGIYVQYVELVK
jgi:hypothetical protein